MRRFVVYLLVLFLTFGVGCFFVSKFLIHKEKQEFTGNIQKSVQEKIPKTEHVTTNPKIESEKSACDELYDEVDYQPLIKKWLRGEKLKNVPYCTKEATEAEAYRGSNITPTLIDLNKDGKEELALQSDCSPTGNCAMDIFEKKSKSYQKILTAVHGVQVFELGNLSNKNFYDISARMHGSANSGDLVVYRFNGKQYKPFKCFEYLY